MAQFDSETNLKTKFSFIERYFNPVSVPVSDLIGDPLDNKDKEGVFMTVSYINLSVAPGTFTLTVNSAKLEHSDDDVTYVEVPSDLILGDPFSSLVGVFSGGDPDVLQKISYIGTKKFTRLVLNREVVFPDAGTTPIVYSFFNYQPSTKGSLED